jgi:hypothetical protein
MFSAIAAQSAMAITGTTAFTCKEVTPGTGHFKGAHCKPSDAGTGAGANWDHVAITESKDLQVSNETTGGVTDPMKLKVNIAGVIVTFNFTTVTGVGGMLENKEDVGGEHYAHATGKLKFTGVTANKAGCVVRSGPGGTVGEILTNELTGTTTGEGMNVKIQPLVGNTFASFTIEGCTNMAINGNHTIFGFLTTEPEGATINTTFAQTEAAVTLKFDNEFMVAALEGTLTLKGKKTGVAEPTTAISSTTVTT